MMLSLVSLWTQLLTGRERRMQLWGSPSQQWALIPSRGTFWPLVLLHQAKYT